jgi:hypothetical protein
MALAWMLLLPLVSSCPFPLNSEFPCSHQLIRLSAKFLGDIRPEFEAFVNSLPADLLPLSLPSKLSNSSNSFAIINGREYCYHSCLTIFPLTSFSMDCHFDESLDRCFCNVVAKSAADSLAIITSNSEIELFDLLASIEMSRKLEMTQSDGMSQQDTNRTSAQDRFDIGIVTHGVLVVLSFVSFFGNALFVVYVFWLSR